MRMLQQLYQIGLDMILTIDYIHHIHQIKLGRQIYQLLIKFLYQNMLLNKEKATTKIRIKSYVNYQQRKQINSLKKLGNVNNVTTQQKRSLKQKGQLESNKKQTLKLVEHRGTNSKRTQIIGRKQKKDNNKNYQKLFLFKNNLHLPSQFNQRVENCLNKSQNNNQAQQLRDMPHLEANQYQLLQSQPKKQYFTQFVQQNQPQRKTYRQAYIKTETQVDKYNQNMDGRCRIENIPQLMICENYNRKIKKYKKLKTMQQDQIRNKTQRFGNNKVKNLNFFQFQMNNIVNNSLKKQNVGIKKQLHNTHNFIKFNNIILSSTLKMKKKLPFHSLKISKCLTVNEFDDQCEGSYSHKYTQYAKSNQFCGLEVMGYKAPLIETVDHFRLKTSQGTRTTYMTGSANPNNGDKERSSQQMNSVVNRSKNKSKML